MKTQQAQAVVDSKPAAEPAGPSSIVIVDDDPFFRRKTESWIAADPRFTCVASCEDGESGLAAICSKKPDVALVDFGLPDIKGDAVMWQAKARVPSVMVIAISGIPDNSIVFRAMDARADGFLDKEDLLDPPIFIGELAQALRGGCPLSKRAQKLLTRAWQQWRPDPAILARLTPCEQKVAGLACLGWTEEMIARALGISAATVNTHQKHIHEKLQVHCRAELQQKLLRRERPLWF